MKKLTYWLTIGICAAGTAHATLTPDWAGDDGSAYAEWNSWAGFSIGSSSSGADYFEAYDQSGSLLSGIPGQDDPDAEALSVAYYSDSDGAGLELLDNWDLSFWMPNFSGYSIQESVIQLTYWDDPDDADWRAGFDLGVSLYGGSGSSLTGGLVYLGEELDVEGRITEAWGFTANNSADGFFVDIAADSESLGGGIFLDAVAIDTISYDVVPEPASVVSMMIGGVILAGLRKRARR